MNRSAVGRVATLCLAGLIAVLTGCTVPFTRPQPTPTPRMVDCAALAKKGVKPCPPDSPPLVQPRVVDRTGGKVSASTFHRWSWAWLRSYGYANWAIAHNNDALLRAGILTSPAAVSNSFQQDLDLIQRARAAHGKVEITGPTAVELDLVALPQDLQAALERSGYHASPFGWVFRIKGPQRVNIVTTNTSTSYGSVPSDAQQSTLDWGREVERTPLGPVWTSDGNSVCTSDPRFQQLCGT